MSFDTLAGLVLAHGYLVVFVAVALDCAALPVPGELLLLTIGGLAVKGHLDPVWAIAVAAGAALLADSFSYWMGRLGGQRVFARIGIGRRWTPGLTTLVVGRFVIGARVVLAPMAGARRLPFGRFVLCDMLGATLWAATYVLIGYGAGANLGAVQRHWSSVVTLVQIVLAIAVVAFLAVKFLRAAPLRLKFLRASWLRLVIGTALLALFSVRDATMATAELQHAAAPAADDQAQVWLIG